MEETEYWEIKLLKRCIKVARKGEGEVIFRAKTLPGKSQTQISISGGETERNQILKNEVWIKVIPKNRLTKQES